MRSFQLAKLCGGGEAVNETKKTPVALCGKTSGYCVLDIRMEC